MDRKSLLILAACVVLFMTWSMLVNKLYPPVPTPPLATNEQPVKVVGDATNQVATLSPAPATPVAPKVAQPSDAPEQLLVITNDNARYTFTTHGGGLKQIELVHYPETVRRKHLPGAPAEMVMLNAPSPHPVLGFMGNGGLQEDGVFELTTTDNGVRAEKTLSSGVRLVKEFELGTNYLLSASVRMENVSTQALALPAQEWAMGTATPLGPEDNGSAVGMMWYNGSKTDEINQSWFDAGGFLFFKSSAKSEYRAGSNNVSWAASHNQFFALVAMPKDPAPSLLSLQVDFAHLPSAVLAAAGEPAPKSKGVQSAFVYPAMTLQPGESVTREFQFFAGPKEYRTLARIAARFNNNVDLIMGYGGFFGFFAKILLLSMNKLHDLLSIGYGWAIIIITFIIKMVFWPLTQASTRSMKRMQALQPQMKAIQEKFKDDPAKMNKKLMEFMKENKVSPLGGCLPMLLQIPVFFGFFRMIQSAIELRGAKFLWVSDLSRPDTLFHVAGFPFNLLPLIMGVTMLWQARMTPPSPGMDPTQQKIMRYMPLMFLVFLYNFSAGLTLYWTIQNLLTIAQMKLTKTTPVAVPASVPVAPKKKK